MKKIVLCLLTIVAFFTALAQPGTEQLLAARRLTLPNGWTLSPAGRSISLGDLPLNMAVSSSKRYIAVTNNGQGAQSLQLIDARKEKVLDSITIPRSWYGLQFSADERYLYASGGNDNRILKYALLNNKLVLKDSILLGKKWPEKISPAGIQIDDAASRMYVVTKDNFMLYVINLKDKSILKKIELGAEAYACLLSPDKKELYISLWGGDHVLVYHIASGVISSRIAVGDNPNELLLTKNGRYLFVANANDNSVSVIDIKARKVLEVLDAALYPNAPAGSASNGLALSTGEKFLYIANADNNCLAVFDVSEPGESRSKGFIPVGWYPTNVKVIGKKIFVTNGKGFSSFANPNGPNPLNRKTKFSYQKGDTTRLEKVQYIGNLMQGTMSVIDEPDAATLGIYSKAVYANTPYTKDGELSAQGEPGNPIPMKVGDPSPIKYVFYIIKENRTYDQVLGDMPEGNGDTSLVLFGEKYTPNQHRLAREFVLFDNFYVDGEVSADGHNWSTSANATDYLEKNWPVSYGGRGGEYDAEGTREIANPKRGFIWDYCKRAGVSYRTYGEFADDYKPNIPVLKDHFCPYYTSWDESVRDTTRVGQWKRDFDSLIAVNALPRFNSLRLINDHTEGLRVGRPTPFAHVADNDLAVGMFVEYLSHSSVWKESVVFVVEDDAQNGADHVDAHRSTGYLFGPYVKRKFVDHTMYSTSSFLRTMELILGLPPMSQYDAAATPLWRAFTAVPDYTPYTALPANISLDGKNTVNNASARKSLSFDFSKEDRAPDIAFNEVLWKAVHGEDSKPPAPRRSAFVRVVEKAGEDD
jgi:YVTN family beta-propeller protein